MDATMDATSKVPSPYLPNTSIRFAWDSTTLGAFKTCPRLYQYLYIDGWAPKDESVHLTFGSRYHEAIQDYDIAKASGASHTDAIHTAIRNLLIRTRNWVVDEETKAGKYKNRRTLLQLCVDYFDFFADDPAQTYILENGKPAVELSFKFHLDWGPKQIPQSIIDREIGFQHGLGRPEEDITAPNSIPQPYLLCGHLDRVVTFNDSSFVLDHKTTTTQPGSYFFNQFEPNNQMTLYTLASQVIIQSPVRGVIVEAAQILLEKPNRFERGFTYRTQGQLDEWVADLHYTLSLAETFAEAGHWPMNDTACDKYGGCKFREVCSKDPRVRPTWLASDFVKLPEDERWNPLKPR